MQRNGRGSGLGRRLLKAWLPPVVTSVVNERRRRYYPSIAEASQASSGAWQSESLTRFRIAEAKQNLPSLQSGSLPAGYSLLLATMALLDVPAPTICDLGGGCGAWGYRLAKDVNRPFSYTVVEHAGLVVACGEDRFFSWGTWSTQLPSAYDVLICSGTLQCLEQPYDVWRQALKHTRKYALIARTTFCERDYAQVQVSTLSHNGHSASVPPGYDPNQRIYYAHRTIRLPEVLKIAEEEGFDVHLKLHPAPSSLAPGAFDHDMILKRRDARESPS